MKIPLTVLLLAALLAQGAANDSRVAVLCAADNARIAATIAADRARMEAGLSDELRYAHSSGVVDTKAALIESVVSGQLKYLATHYEEREFTFPAPGVALMTGRSQVKSATPAGGATEVRLSFLAVWRLEKGQWRFLAWQSCKLPSLKAETEKPK